MRIELAEQECQNVRVALRSLMKAPEVNEDAMKQLLVLSDKFVQPVVVKPASPSDSVVKPVKKEKK